MKIFTTLLFLSLAGCKSGGTPFAAPSVSDVSAITAQIYNMPDGGTEIPKFEVPSSSYKAMLESLNGAAHDNHAMKWQFLGDIDINLTTGSTIEVELFRTGEQVGAFRASGVYYRGGSDTDFIRLISTAKKQHSEQAGAGQPATAPESKPEGKEKPELESKPAPR